jgi:hypothetical protein
MHTISFGGSAIVAAVALAAPLALGRFPRTRLPSIVLGIVIGSHALGWVSIDTPITVISLPGLAFLLFLAEFNNQRDGIAASRSTASTVVASRTEIRLNMAESVNPPDRREQLEAGVLPGSACRNAA